MWRMLCKLGPVSCIKRLSSYQLSSIALSEGKQRFLKAFSIFTVNVEHCSILTLLFTRTDSFTLNLN